MIREQLVGQKVQGRNSVAAGKRARSTAKPKVKRSTTSDWQNLKAEFQELLPYLFVAGIAFLSLITLALLFLGYRAATHSAFFQLKEVNISGTVRTSAEEIKNLTHKTIGKSGVWNANIDAIQNEIEKLPWIRKAIVSRVLPDGIRIRIIEREAQAVVRLSKDRTVLVDEDGNILAAATNKDKPAPFILRGWDEAVTESAKEDNKERVEVYREIVEEFGLLGIAHRVREVNLSDVNDVRTNTSFGEATVEFRLGDKDFGKRLKYAIEKIEVERGATDFRCISYVDVRQGISKGDRLAFGTRTNCSASTEETLVNEKSANTDGIRYNETTGRMERADGSPVGNNDESTRIKNKQSDSNKKNEQVSDKKKQEQDSTKNNQDNIKNNKKSSNTKSESRPRKV